MIKIGIVIPTFNRDKLLSVLLDQIVKYDKQTMDVSTIVVNDGSTDRTDAILKEHMRDDRFFIINGDGNWWWTKSFNAGMIYAFNDLKMDYVLSLNDDVELYENFFYDLKNVIGTFGDLHGKKYIFNCGSKNIATNEYCDLGVLKNYSNPFKIHKNTIKDFELNKNYIKVNHNHGRGLFFPKELYNAIGELDYNLFPQYLGDSDYGLRAMNAGFAQYFTKAPYLKSFVELTSKSAYEKTYNFSNFYKRISNKYSDSNLKMFYAFNKRHFKGLDFLQAMSADLIKINGGYIKRWLKSSLGPSK